MKVNRKPKTLELIQKEMRSNKLFKVMLTHHLGYRSPTTIDKWVQRKEIPLFQLRSVAEFLKSYKRAP